MKRFYEIFRAGNYPQGTFSEDDVKAIAENYDPSFLEAPLTLDHGWGGPAFGWIEELKAEGGRLLATFKDVSDDLRSMVAKKQYKRHSCEIYNDLNGKGPYLKALSMLGASSPQVKGMEPIAFSQFSEKYPEDESATVDFEAPVEPENELFSEFLQARLAGLDKAPETFAEETGVPQAILDKALDGAFDEDVPGEAIASFTDLMEDLEADSFADDFQVALANHVKDLQRTDEPKTYSEAEVSQKISEFQERIDNLTNELESQKQTSQEFKSQNEQIRFAQRKKEFTSFLAAQVEAGKLLPKLKGKAATMFGHLDGLPAGEDEESPLELFKDIINDLPAINLEEQAKKTGAAKQFDSAQEIADAAVKYKQEQEALGNHVSVAQAVTHVKNQQK